MQINLKTIPRETDPILRRVIEPLAGWIVLLSGMLVACWWPGITEEVATRTITVFTLVAVAVFGWSYVQKLRHRDDADGRVLAGFNIGMGCAVVAWTGLRFLFIRLGGDVHTVDRLQGIAVGVGIGVLICFAVFVARRMFKNESERKTK